MRRSIVLLLCAGLAAATGLALAAPGSAPLGGTAASRLPEGLRLASVDAARDLPRFVFDHRGAKPATRDPLTAARAHLAALAPAYRLDASALAELEYATRAPRGDRPVLVRVTRKVDGLEVLGSRLTLVMRPDLALVAVGGNLSPHRPLRLTGEAKAAGLDADAALAVVRAGYAARGAGRLVGAPHQRQVWFPLADRLEPAWSIEQRATDGERTLGEAWVVSARDGQVLERRNLMNDASYAYRVWASTTGDEVPHDGPQGDGATPHPTGVPDQFLPPPVARGLVTLSSSDYRLNDPWLPNGAAQLEGNNVFAYADQGPDGFDAGDTLGSTSGPNAFDHAYDPALAHDANPAQVRAAITQGFYVINWLHDWFHEGGFDEAAGTHQQSNFGRGGANGDPLLLEAQDAQVFDNANAWAPSDGASPVIQMGVWSGDTARSAAFTGSSGFSASFGRTGTGGAQFGPQSFSLDAPLVAAFLSVGGTGPSFTLYDACSPTFSNAGALAGAIALVDRGNCFFIDKARNLEAVGAVGMVVVNHLPETDPNGGVFTMALPEGETDDVGIPALMLSKEDGDPLRAALAGQAIDAALDRTAGITLDSTVDTSILAHEWGHVLNNRLMDVGSVNGTQPDGMDEGYADFVALLLLVGPEAGPAAYQGIYPVSPYAAALFDDDGYYFGIRRYPYTTDLARNPLTFGHIEDGVALPGGAPIGPGVGINSEVHNVGEVWASMLWECYVALLRDGRFTYTEARERMRDYLVDAQMATPSTPNFVEARDAWLAVAAARSSADFTLFAAAFAKRGLGDGAVAPLHASAANANAIESFVPVATPPPGGGGGGGGSGGGSNDDDGGGGAVDLVLLGVLAVAALRRRRGGSARR